MLKFFLFMLIAGFAHALTEEDIKVMFTKHAMKCMKTNPVSMEDIINLQKLIVPTKPDAKCLLACAYRAQGTMTANGLYDLEHAYKVAEMMKNGDETRFENAKKMSELCAKVNDVEVSDGEKGCERAALMFKCATENAPKFGFKV